MRSALALLALLSTAAYGADLTANWTNATQNTDGSAIPASGAGSLVSTRVEIGSCSGVAFGTKSGEQTASMPTTKTVFVNLAPGTYCIRAFHKNTYGMESVASAIASKTIAPPTPSSPTLTTIDVAAYQVVTQRNKFALVKVGTVPLKAACIAGQSVNGYTIVPRYLVKFSGSNRPEAVVAKCG